MMVSRPRQVSSHRLGRGRRHQMLLAAAVGCVIVLGVALVMALVSPPAFLAKAEERPSSAAASQVPPVEDRPAVRIAIAGDTGTRDAAVAATAKRMEIEEGQDPYDALILLGDLIYEKGNAELTRQSITAPFAGILDHARLIPVLGNHDVRSGEQQQILGQLGYDSLWYEERVGPVRVIVLDSNQVDNQDQTIWLRDELAKKEPQGTWTIVAMHHPAYSAGDHGSDMDVRKTWSPLFDQAKVPLVLAGHDHDYQRSLPQDGVTYIVSGAGAKLRSTGKADFTAVSTSTLHYVDLLVYDDRLVGRAIGQDGQLIDEFTIDR